MDWDNIRGEKPRPAPAPPFLELIEMSWRLQTPSGRVLTCGVYGTEGPGVEVRAGFGEDDLRRSQRAAELGSGRELAESWRQAALAKGTFTELPTDGVCNAHVSHGGTTEALRRKVEKR